MSAGVVPLRFRVGLRTLMEVSRRVHRVGWSLDALIEGPAPALPPIAPGEQGWLITSVPEEAIGRMGRPGFLVAVRQRYHRHYATLDGGYEAWLAGLSGNARSSIKRKTKKLATHADGMAIERFRTADEMRAFHARARPLARRTYQERLLGAGLPEDPEFMAEMAALAASDRARAWLMTLGGRPIAYLWCGAEGASLRYDYVGHDPDFAELSPGTVLHAQAFADLFAEGCFARFDFTEGEGQHKRQFATGAVACADLLVLRDTLGNRALTGALGAFDGGVAAAKRIVGRRVRHAA